MPLSSAIYSSLFFTVALLVTMAYFLLGGLPLLILAHDEALDSRFIKNFFNVHYRAVFWIALCACISFTLWGRFPFAVGAALIAILAVLLRKHLISAMHQMSARIEASEERAIQRFRRLHAMALSVNFAQVLVMVWGLVVLSRQLA